MAAGGDSQATVELSATEQLFGALFAQSNVPVCIADRDGALLYANTAFTGIVGALTDAVRANALQALVHPDDLALAAAELARVLAGEGSPGFEARVRTPDGTFRWLAFSSTIDQTSGRVCSVAFDITQRKEQEQRLNDLVRTFELAGEIAQIGHWRADLRTRSVTWSEWMYRIFGWDKTASKPDILSVVGTYKPDEVQRLRAAYLQAIVSGDPFTFERRLTRADGHERWIATRGQTEKDTRGATVGVFGVVQDITERKASEQQIARLAMLAAKTRTAVVITDALGLIAWVNDGFTTLTGYTLNEVAGRFPWNLVDGPDADREALRAIRATLDRREPVHAEIVMYTKDQERRWVDLEIQPVPDSEGTITSYIALETDITALQLGEAELQRAHEAAVEASRLKSQFLANMSHEIRTPMNGILGMTELLLETTLSEDQRACLASIATGGRHLLELLGDILDISKIEAGRLELSEVPFEPARLLGDVVRTHTARATEKGLTLALEVAPDLPPQWLGDPMRVTQITANLVGNAIKFTGAGGVRVTLAAAAGDTDSAYLPGPAGRPAGIVIGVHDSGIGIPPEKHGAIFLPFFQVDGSAARRYSGTGLGLAICRQLVEAMGGRISVESAEGRGATFLVQLPLTPAHAAPHTATASASPCGSTAAAARGPLSVLVAEDNPTNAFVLRRMLERDGHHVVVVTTGSEAVRTARQGDLDAILMDVQMPEMDGLEATRLIRLDEAARGVRAIPIVAVTANAMAGDAGQCLAAGMNHHLPKPVSLDALREMLARLG